MPSTLPPLMLRSIAKQDESTLIKTRPNITIHITPIHTCGAHVTTTGTMWLTWQRRLYTTLQIKRKYFFSKDPN